MVRAAADKATFRVQKQSVVAAVVPEHMGQVA